MPDPIQSERFEPRSVSEDAEDMPQRARPTQAVQGTAALREIPGVVAASRLECPLPPVVSSGVAEIDTLTGGFPQGALTEIVGPASSGRTTCLLAAVAEATRRGEVCAVVDATDAFDPQSAEQAGVDLDRVLWVRCAGNAQQSYSRTAELPRAERNIAVGNNSSASDSREDKVKPWSGAWPRRPPARSERPHEFGMKSARISVDPWFENPKGELPSLRSQNRGGFRERWGGRLEQALKATDMLLQSGGFGLVAVDFGDVPADAARRVPLASWFRFRRAVENTPTVLLVVEQEAFAKSCASLVLSLSGSLRYSTIPNLGSRGGSQIGDVEERPAHTRLLDGITVTAELVRGERKPVRSAQTEFESRTAWGR